MCVGRTQKKPRETKNQENKEIFCMKKRFLPALLALAMVLALLPVSAFAAPEDEPGAPAAQTDGGTTGNTDYYYYAPAAETLSVNLVKLVADMAFPEATTDDTTVTLTTAWTDSDGQEVSGRTVAGTTYRFTITVAAAENYSLREGYTATVTNYPDAVLSNNVISGTAAVEAGAPDTSGAVAAAVKTAMGDACAAELDSALYESGYTARAGEAAAADNADFKVAVAVKGLRRHENSGNMGYWVGVNFPKTVADSGTWTLTTYKRDGQTAKTLGEGDFTGDVLADYYNVADAGEGVENAAMRKVELTYSQESATAAVTVLVDLTGVEIVLPPAPEAGNDGQLDEDAQNTLKDAIAAAGNTASTDPYAEAPDTIQVPVVSVDFSAAAEAGSAGTIPADIVESLQTVNEDSATNDVGLKIKGGGGAEATLDPKAIGKLSGSAALTATVKAEAVTADKANAIADATTKTKVAELLTRYAGNGVKAVTVDMKQGGTSPFAAADAAIAITVKIPVPDAAYTAVLHISASGVTKHTGLTVKTEEGGSYVELKVTHLSDLIPAKPADLAGIDEENPPAADGRIVDVKYIASSAFTSDADKRTYFGGKLTVKNVSGVEKTFLVSFTGKNADGSNVSVTAGGETKALSICQVKTLAAGETWDLPCQKILLVEIDEIAKNTDLSGKFNTTQEEPLISSLASALPSNFQA